MPPPLAGRPLKRPGEETEESPAGPGDGPSSPKLKIPRVERTEDFSTIVKNKLHSYTRTGQACDRCKVRKIRCDALPEGCSHCTSQSLECYVTDRVTGRTERRGYLQELEREKRDMLAHIRELEKLLDNNGVQVAPWQWSAFSQVYPPGMMFDAVGNPVNDPTSKDGWSQIGSVWVKNSKMQKPSAPAQSLSSNPLLDTRPTDSHLGVMADNAPLSSIKGTQLSILGMTIDITSFDAPDMDEPPLGAQITSPIYNKSVQAFLNSTMGVNPRLDDVPLPSRSDAFTYAEWYFLMILPFVPVLHKPSFMKLLTRIYDDPSFKPSAAELIIVNMVFATIYFQYGVRNREEPEKQAHLNDLSNKHYHWCLGRFYDLTSDSSLATVQALALIVVHTRAFPKPGCGSLVATFAFNKAIELGFHRSMRRPEDGVTLEDELRKRAWWTILLILVSLHGRLGRPMPITVAEFDCEFPVVVPDDYLTEQGISDPSKIGQSPFISGLYGFRIIPAYLELFTTMYSVRRDPSKYIDMVHSLEAKHREWQQGLPDDLRVETCRPGMQIFALYTKAFSLEFELCLRHPSVCLTSDQAFCAENFRRCEDAARQLLYVVDKLFRLKSLDTTWYQMSVYVAAAFSLLVSHWKRRFEITPAEVALLRTEMEMWLTIISEMGRLLGSGSPIPSQISAIIQRTIAWIEHDMRRKTEASQVSRQQPQLMPEPVKHESFTETPEQLPEMRSATPTVNNGNPAGGSGIQTSTAAGNGAFYENSMPQATAASYSQLAFPDHGGAAPTATNGNGAMAGFDPNDSSAYMYAGPGPANGAEQNPLVAFASQAAQQVSGQVAAGGATEDWSRALVGGGNSWHDWTAAIADSQDRYSANALLTLGGAQQRDGAGAGPGGEMGGNGGVAAGGPVGQWPMLIFHDESGPASGG